MDVLHYKIKRLVEAARLPWLVAHRNPDGDTLGAMLAFGLYLDGIGKPHLRFCVDVPAPSYAFMPGVQTIKTDPQDVFRAVPDVIITFDAGDIRMTHVGGLLDQLPHRPAVVVFDHHATNERFGAINAVQTDAVSTTEVVHRYLAAVGATITPDIATNLLAGLCTDTSNFSNPATTTSALRLAGDLMSRGAQFREVFTALYRNKSVSVLKLWGAALERLRLDSGTGLATTAIFLKDFQETGVPSGASSEGLSNFLAAVLNVPTIMVLREADDGLVKGSLRTVEERDVSEIAKQYGGGGHKKAAGFSTKGTIELSDGRWSVSLNSPPSEGRG